MNALSETDVVFAHELRRGLRSAKALALLVLYGLASVVASLVFVAAQRGLEKLAKPMTGGRDLTPDELLAAKKGGLAFLFGGDHALAARLAETPLVVLFFFKVALVALPLLVVLMAYDQIAGELQTRSIRYAALRCRRGSLLAGKVLAQAALLFAMTALVNTGLFTWSAASTEGFPVLAGLAAMVRFWLLGLFPAAAWLGLVALCSAVYRTPIYALLSALGAMLGFWLLSLVARFSEPLAPLGYLVPSRWEAGLFDPSPASFLPSMAAFAAFAAAFLAAAWLLLRRRDL